MITLLVIELFFVAANLILFKYDILTPAAVSSITFLIATLFAAYSAALWEIKISALTIAVIAVGLLGMTLGELTGRKSSLSFGSGRSTAKLKQNKNVFGCVQVISIKGSTIISFTAFIIVCSAVYVFEAYRVGNMNGGSGLNAFAYMKNAYSSGSGYRMNPIIRQLYKVVFGAAYLSCFIFTNNCLVNRDKFFRNLPHFAIIVCGVAVTIAAGSRTEILRILSAMLLDFMILWRIKNGVSRKQNRRSSKELAKKILPYAMTVVVIAYGSRAIVKTANTATAAIDSILYYVAYYVGSSISVLNTKLNIAFSGIDIIFGANTRVSNFVYLGSLDYGGNVATILFTRMYYNGLIIMFLYVFLLYAVGGSWFSRLSKIKILNTKTIWSIILFSNWYYIFVMSYYSDILSEIGTIVSNILICAVCFVLFRIITPHSIITVEASEGRTNGK